MLVTKVEVAINEAKKQFRDFMDKNKLLEETKETLSINVTDSDIEITLKCYDPLITDSTWTLTYTPHKFTAYVWHRKS